MDVKIQALENTYPNETEWAQSHLLFSNFASFDGLSNWCSALIFTNDWVKPTSFSKMGNLKSCHWQSIRLFKLNRSNFSFVRSSASTLVSRGRQLSWQRIFIDSHCERYSIKTIITGNFVLSFRVAKEPAALLSVPPPQCKIWAPCKPDLNFSKGSTLIATKEARSSADVLAQEVSPSSRNSQGTSFALNESENQGAVDESPFSFRSHPPNTMRCFSHLASVLNISPNETSLTPQGNFLYPIENLSRMKRHVDATSWGIFKVAVRPAADIHE